MGNPFKSAAEAAAEKIVKGINTHMTNLNDQVKGVRNFLEKEVHGFLTKANVEDVLKDTRETLLKTSYFLDTSTVAVKILSNIVAIVLLVIAMLFGLKLLRILSSNSAVNWLMKTMVELVMFLCLAMILLLFYQLFMIELFGFEHGVNGTGIWNLTGLGF